MMQSVSSKALASIACIAALAFGDVPAKAQTASTEPKLDRGFSAVLRATATGAEIRSQPALWVMEVHFKPMRMITVELTDPRTGRKRPELVWYLVYRAIQRPLKRQPPDETEPRNATDPPPGPPMFIPDFALVTEDNGVQRIYYDQILPEAQRAIVARERLPLKNCVEIVQPVPPPVAPDESPADSQILYGVVTWRGIDAETDFFRLYMTGFSNGYKYVDGPVSFAGLQQLAQSGELRSSDELWDGVGTWQLAGTVPGLFDPTTTPDPSASERSWYRTITRDRFPQGQRPLVYTSPTSSSPYMR